MSQTINPLSYQSMKIDTPTQRQSFLNSLSISLRDILNAISTLGTANSVLGGQLRIINQAFNPAPAAQTVNCANACTIAIDYDFNSASTLTLTNLAPGIPILIRGVNLTAGTLVLKVAASNPSSVTYNVLFFSGGSFTDFTATGWSATANQQRIFIGIPNSVGADLFFAAP